MANSPAGTSSDNAGGRKYQVFLNFHGRDTRVGFTSFLYQDLRKNGIHAFMDDEGLRVGEEIGGELLQAIDDSQIYISIFSQNYASSKWCLCELARMVDNTTNKSEDKKIMPIFYDVEPDDVDLKTPLYRTTIEKHKEEHNNKFPHEAESWEEALKKVDKIKGWVLPKYKNQAELVDSVVEKVLQELKIRHKSVTKDLVGLDDQVAKVLEKLDVNSSDEVRLLGIYGMGGIGKTTLARVVYNKLSSHFGKCCAFLDNVRETSKKKGLLWLQKKLLTSIDSCSAAKIIDDVDPGRERIEATFGSKKVLIVLDDVDEKKQIENLIGQGRLYPGTRIIITTRNASVLEFTKQRMAPEMKEVNFDHAIRILPHEMEGMNFDHALQLFKRHASVDNPKAKDFDSLSRDIVNTTGGLPLALEVIGSLLFEKPKAKWEDTLNQLKKMPNECVQETLMISYQALSHRQCKIFLDVACFFINEDMINASYMWEACGFDPNSEIGVFVEMSLIKIKDNKFWMHDQLRDLGQEIVCQENLTNLGKRSRLWTSEEVFDLVKTEKMKENVEALDLQGKSSHIFISHEEIGRFKSLRFLRLSYGTLHGDFFFCLPKLRWLSWRSPSPHISVCSTHSKNLVVLELFDNCFTDDSKIWDLIKMAIKLKNLALVECHGITKTPELSECMDLERLTFDNCEILKEIDSSIGKLKCLLDLNITYCGLLIRVPDEVGGLVKLERFSLRSCCNVPGLPTSIGNLASLRKLDLSMTGITSLPNSIEKLRCLSDLNLQGSKITEIPDEIEGLVELQHLCLKDTMIKQLPYSIGKLKSLCTLDLSKRPTGFPAPKFYPNLWELPKAIGMLDKLEELSLGHRKELARKIPDEIGKLSSLRVLDLCSTRIYRVPRTISMLSHLSTLDLTGCDEIRELPDLPASLVCLRVISRSLQMVPNLSKLTNLVELVLCDGSKGHSSNLKDKCDLRWIGRLSKLKKLHLCLPNIAAPPTEFGSLSLLQNLTLCKLNLQPLKQLPPSLLALKLCNFSLTGSLLSNLKIPSNLTLRSLRLREIKLDGLSQLQSLLLDGCDLQSLSIPSSLRKLSVVDCPNMIEIQFLGMSASLEELGILGCRSIGRMVLCSKGGSLGVLDQSESSLGELTYCSPGVLLLPNAWKKLKRLEVRRCENLLEIQVIGTLLLFQDISIESCNAMEKLSGISNLKNLHRLDIRECSKLRVVEGLDKLEFLTWLEVEKCPSLETLLDISNSKIPDKCMILVIGCRESLRLSGCATFKFYKEMAQQDAPQSETNKEAKMEGDAEEPVIKLWLQFHPSASSQDHDREGTLPGNQNQTRHQDLSPLSLDKLGKENQTMEQDSNPLSLDELAPPRTFCDSLKTCLVSILEFICNCKLS